MAQLVVLAGDVTTLVVPLSVFQPVTHVWCIKGYSICFALFGIVYITDPIRLLKNIVDVLWEFILDPLSYILFQSMLHVWYNKGYLSVGWCI